MTWDRQAAGVGEHGQVRYQCQGEQVQHATLRAAAGKGHGLADRYLCRSNNRLSG
jgi:hypothetical protein